MEEIDKMDSTKSTLDDKSEQEYLYTQATVETNGNQNQIVTDKQTKDLDNSDSLIIKTDGKYYEVKEGSFIIDSRVINMDENTKSIEFLENPRRTITTN